VAKEQIIVIGVAVMQNATEAVMDRLNPLHEPLLNYSFHYSNWIEFVKKKIKPNTGKGGVVVMVSRDNPLPLLQR